VIFVYKSVDYRDGPPRAADCLSGAFCRYLTVYVCIRGVRVYMWCMCIDMYMCMSSGAFCRCRTVYVCIRGVFMYMCGVYMYMSRKCMYVYMCISSGGFLQISCSVCMCTWCTYIYVWCIYVYVV